MFKWNCPLDRIGTALLIFFIENLSVTCIWLDVRFKLYWFKYLFLPHKLQSFGYWLIFSSKKDFLDINVQCTCKKDKYCNNIIVASLRGFTIYMLCMFVCCQWALVQMTLLFLQELTAGKVLSSKPTRCVCNLSIKKKNCLCLLLYSIKLRCQCLYHHNNLIKLDRSTT